VRVKIYVCKRRMYVCERARMNYGLHSPSYISQAVVWALHYGSCYLHIVNPGQCILKLFNCEVL